MSRITFFAGISFLVLLIAGGCSSAKLSNSWKKDGYTAKSTSMLVIGVSSHSGRRQIFESTIVQNLKERGVYAIPGYSVFSYEDLDRQAVIEYAKKENIDSVIVTKVLDSKSINQRSSYVTGSASGYAGRARNPYYHGFNGWHDDYSFWRTNVVTYDTSFRLSNLEANLYLLEGKDMIWSALVEVESMDNDKSAIRDLADLLVKQLARDGVI